VLIDLMDVPLLRRMHDEALRQGKIEGILEGRRAALAMMLRIKFRYVPKWAERRIADADVAELDRLTGRTLRSDSLKRVFEA
jgi:hypothetical protein